MSVRRQASSVVTGRECRLNAFHAKVRYESIDASTLRISDSVKAKSFAVPSAARLVFETTNFGFSCILANRSFHLQCDQAIHFDGIFHRQFFDEGFDKTRNNHRGSFLFTETARHEIEE